MREYIVQYERKESDNPKDKCDLCDHAIVGEVVRCKDCKHWKIDSHCDGYRSAEDFCSWGERGEP